MRWRLNLLALEEDEAKSLGIPIQRTRYILIILPHFAQQAGLHYGDYWLGRFALPHIARLLVGANFILLLPTSLLLGASFYFSPTHSPARLQALNFPSGF